MHEPSYTKEDLRQILLGISLPIATPVVAVAVPCTKIEPLQKPLQEPPLVSPSKNEPKEVSLQIIQEPFIEKKTPIVKKQLPIKLLPFVTENSSKILNRWPLLAKNIKSRQKQLTAPPPEDSFKTVQLQEEIDRLNHTIVQLTQSLSSYKSIAKSKEDQLRIFQDLQTTNSKLSEELTIQKRNLARLVCDRKELDENVTFMNQEKVTLIAKLKELSTKNASYTTSQQELQKQIDLKEGALCQVQNQLQELSRQREDEERSYKQELSVSTACLLEKQQALEEERKKGASFKELYEQSKAKTQELEAHEKQLEQHLARRVKECAHFLKKAEDSQEEVFSQKQKLATLESSLQNVVQNFEALKTKNEELTFTFNEQTTELALLRKEKERLAQVELLFSQCEKLFSKPTHE